MVNYFICSTPYHVMNSIFIKYNYFDRGYNILLLTNNSSNARVLFDNIIRTGIFQECYFIDDRMLREYEKNRVKRFFQIIRRYTRRTFINDFVELKLQPDNIIVFSFTCFNSLAQSRLVEMNSRCKIYVGEDGIRDYIYEDFGISEPQWFIQFKKTKKKIGHQIITIPNNYKRILYRPEIRKQLYDDDNTLNISDNSTNYKLFSIIENVFSYTPDMEIKERYIYFDSVYDSYHMKRQKELIDFINSRCSSIVIKKHPRNEDTYEGISVYPYSNIPWEVLCFSSNLGQKTLITVNSNACFSPKFILDVEPKIIFLYKLIFDDNEIEDTEKIVANLIDMYRDKTKIQVPNSLDELECVLQERLNNE